MGASLQKGNLDNLDLLQNIHMLQIKIQIKYLYFFFFFLHVMCIMCSYTTQVSGLDLESVKAAFDRLAEKERVLLEVNQQKITLLNNPFIQSYL